MPREETLRQYFLRRVKAYRGRVYKLSPVGRRGKPDELVLLPFRTPLMVELKKKGKKPEAHQLREHKRLAYIGHHVFVVDNRTDVEVLLGRPL